MARVVEPGPIGVGEVLDHGERRRVRWHLRQRERPEVLLEMPQQCVADALAEHHPTRHHHSADRAVGRDTQQQADLGHHASAVDPHRDGVDVHERHVGAHLLELFG